MDIFTASWPQKAGAGTAPITSSTSPNSIPTTLGRNPCDLRGIYGGRGIHLGPEDSSTQHKIRGDTRNTSRIQSPSAGHYHNLFELRHGRLIAPPCQSTGNKGHRSQQDPTQGPGRQRKVSRHHLRASLR